ncbi:hypothetical protein L1987_74785 [Smallanthus sonchifolius]|uniref:Uncharacterized protein n=1 Tax=Smallanthus sonchifolius TaxID=185202 RepID=A0ACB9A4V3_9ASTR|nr:hypothetical protein L1987_74785 [Smallanthus sonchifolius]
MPCHMGKKKVKAESSEVKVVETTLGDITKHHPPPQISWELVKGAQRLSIPNPPQLRKHIHLLMQIGQLQCSFLAYYGGGAPPPFFPSIVASPTPHPYIWGGQHPMMPPYGAPVPYPTLYSPPEVYAHPGTPMVIRQKVASSSGNDGTTTQSAESENDGSSDANLQNDNSGNPVVHATAGNPNRGIDLSNPSAGNVGIEMQSNPSGAPQTIVPPPIMGQWARQDERELKRQKRKQSNRESARRSRMRKQAECEELQARVEVLSNENQGLKDELQRLSEECKKLTSENHSIKGKLSKFREPEAASKLDDRLKSRSDEGQN